MSSNCSKSTQIENRNTMEEIITKDSNWATIEEILTKDSNRATIEEIIIIKQSLRSH